MNREKRKSRNGLVLWNGMSLEVQKGKNPGRCPNGLYGLREMSLVRVRCRKCETSSQRVKHGAVSPKVLVRVECR